MHYQWRGGGHVSDKSPNNQNQYNPEEEADHQNKHNKHDALKNTDCYAKNNNDN